MEADKEVFSNESTSSTNSPENPIIPDTSRPSSSRYTSSQSKEDTGMNIAADFLKPDSKLFRKILSPRRRKVRKFPPSKKKSSDDSSVSEEELEGITNLSFETPLPIKGTKRPETPSPSKPRDLSESKEDVIVKPSPHYARPREDIFSEEESSSS